VKGYELLLSVLSKPLKQIVDNTGFEIEPIYKMVYEADGNFGYNVKTGEVEDLISAGIIDSAKALKCALINAASVSAMALITECTIITVA